MKVCLLNDSFPPVIDGVATTVTNYASILTQTGRAQVVVGTPKYPDVDYTGYPFEVVPYTSFDLPDFADGYRAGNPLAMKALSRLSKFQPDIIHVHCPAASAIMGRVLRNETDAPMIFTYHTKYDQDIARAVKSEHIQNEAIKAMIANISAADEVWTVSQGAGDNLRSLGYEGEIRVVSNGVDFEKGRADAALVDKAVAGYDLPAGVPMFLFVGRIINYKGLPLILDAMQRLTAAGQDYRMVFIGAGVDAPGLQETVRRAGISLDIRQEDGTLTSETGSQKCGKVIFTGPVYDRSILRGWNTRADLFLFPSTYDTNGIVVREAAACGLASVLIKGSCAAEGITHARNGYTVDETGEAIAALLLEIGTDLETMHTVGQHAMDEIYISWEESVMRAADRYQVVLEMQHAGTLKPRRDGKSDKFLQATTDVLDGLYDVFHIPKALWYGTQNVIGGSLLGLQDSLARIPENLMGMQENFAEAEQYLRRKREELRESWHEFRAETRENLHDAREELKEEWNKISGSKM